MPRVVSPEEARRLALTKRARYADGSPIAMREPAPPPEPVQPPPPAPIDVEALAQALRPQDTSEMTSLLRQVVENTAPRAEPQQESAKKLKFTVTKRDDYGRALEFEVEEQ